MIARHFVWAAAKSLRHFYGSRRKPVSFPYVAKHSCIIAFLGLGQAMDHFDSPLSRLLLRATGAALLAAGCLVCMKLAVLGPQHVGHEPPVVYLDVLIAFLCGSAGGALLFYGHHLFDHVGVSDRWAMRDAADETDWGY